MVGADLHIRLIILLALFVNLTNQGVSQGIESSSTDTIVMKSGDSLFVTQLKYEEGALKYRDDIGRMVYLRIDQVSYANVEIDTGVWATEDVIPPVEKRRTYSLMSLKGRWDFFVSPIEAVPTATAPRLSGFNNTLITFGLEYFPLQILSLSGKFSAGVSPSTQYLTPVSRFVSYSPERSGIDRQSEVALELLNLDYSMTGGITLYTKSKTTPFQLFFGADFGFAQVRANVMDIFSYTRTDTVNQWAGTEIVWERDSVVVEQQVAGHLEYGFQFGISFRLKSTWMIQFGMDINQLYQIDQFGVSRYQEYRDGIKYGDENTTKYHGKVESRSVLVLNVKRFLGRKSNHLP